MQIRTDDDIFNKRGRSSRPISQTSLLALLENATTAGNELREDDSRTTRLQSEPESRSQQPCQQPRPSTSPPPLIPELIDHIVDHLHDDKQSLIQCSRTSRAFSHATSYHLFRTVRVPSARRCVQFRELIQSSLHPLSSTSAHQHQQPSLSLPPSTSSVSTTSISSPASRLPRHQTTQSHPQSRHPHPHSNHTNANSHITYAPACDALAAGWDISKFVRKIEFHRLDPQSPIEEYVSEAVKLVGMLPRIREIVFGWWMEVHGLEKIGRAFATTFCHHNQPPSSVSTNPLSETRIEQRPGGDPLKLCLELVDFDSVRTFLDLLGSFGGRLRELSLVSVSVQGGNGKDAIEGRCFPGLESVCLGYDAVVHPKGFGGGGPTAEVMMNMNLLLGMSAFNHTQDLCEMLEIVAPNVSELQLFGDDVPEVCMSHDRMLRLPRFRRLELVNLHVPGPHWSDLIYEIAAWFARDKKSLREIADPSCQNGRASASLSVTPSLPSRTSTTWAGWWANWKRTRIRFAYPVRKGDVDWRKLESAVLGEDFERLDEEYDCAGFGNHGGEREIGNDGDEILMGINRGKSMADSGSSRQLTAGSLWVEVGSGSTGLGEVRGELARLEQLGLLQISCR